MRRIPFILVKNNKVEYLCPKCRNIIPRDLYVLQDECPSCGHSINKTALTIMKVYKLVDKEFYMYFIDKM